jgi:hypothetical protein
MKRQGKVTGEMGGVVICTRGRKKAFRQAVHKFLADQQELELPGIAKFTAGLIHDTKTGQVYTFRLMHGYYTTGTYRFIAQYNNPKVPVNKLDEELYLDLIHECGDQLVYRGQVQLKCSRGRVVLRVENSAPHGPEGKREPTVFEGVHEYRSASHGMLGFVTLVDTVFRRLLAQPAESSIKAARVVASKGGSGSASHGANDSVLSLLRAFTGALDEHRD